MLAGGLFACTTVDPQFESRSPTQQAEARIELGMSYLRLNQLDVAEQQFEQALRITSRVDGAYHGLGLIAAQRQDDVLAEFFFAKAVSVNSGNLQAVNDYSVVLCRNGKARAGLSQLNRIKEVAEEQGNLGTSLALGGCHLALNQYHDAEQAYLQTLNIHPRLEQALLPMAEIKHHLGNNFAARAFIERYLGAGYSSPKALLLGAEVERLLDNRRQHQAYLEKLWARYPGSAQAKAARERYKRY